jgi:hypothetical protein
MLGLFQSHTSVFTCKIEIPVKKIADLTEEDENLFYDVNNEMYTFFVVSNDLSSGV